MPEQRHAWIRWTESTTEIDLVCIDCDINLSTQMSYTNIVECDNCGGLIELSERVHYQMIPEPSDEQFHASVNAKPAPPVDD